MQKTLKLTLNQDQYNILLALANGKKRAIRITAQKLFDNTVECSGRVADYYRLKACEEQTQVDEKGKE